MRIAYIIINIVWSLLVATATEASSTGPIIWNTLDVGVLPPIQAQHTSTDTDATPTTKATTTSPTGAVVRPAPSSFMSDTTPSSTSNNPPATHTVQVGAKQNPHQYSPHTINATVGDVILFEFYPTNHSVVKADYLAPCVPAEKNVFYSGPFNDFSGNDGSVSALDGSCN